jgi:hypothetical protein
MSRIATLAAVLTMVVAPAAVAGPTDLRAPDQQVASQPKPIDLRTPDSRVVFTAPAANVDLRSPDAVNGFVQPAASPQTSSGGSNDVSTWAILAIVAGALGACALLAVMLRRHFQVSRPVGV